MLEDKFACSLQHSWGKFVILGYVCPFHQMPFIPQWPVGIDHWAVIFIYLSKGVASLYFSHLSWGLFVCCLFVYLLIFRKS